jgi:hypothetical protein
MLKICIKPIETLLKKSALGFIAFALPFGLSAQDGKKDWIRPFEINYGLDWSTACTMV